MDDSTGRCQHGKSRTAAGRGAARRGRPSSPENFNMPVRLASHMKEDRPERSARIREALGTRSIVLIGLMGAGKTAVGKRLAQRLDLPFVDADGEIELAAGQSISEIFAEHGEAYF